MIQRGLEAVAVQVTAARAVLSDRPDQARLHLAAAGGIVRQAAERIRQSCADRGSTARDIHDLLGLGLAAVALKCELAMRLIGRDEARVRDELAAVLRLTAQARVELSAVISGAPSLSLRAELTAAHELLTSTGINVETRTGTDRLPAKLDAILATVLREGVTNVLRHANATRCEIGLTRVGHVVTFRIANDGFAADPPRQGLRPGTGGRGLDSLANRATAVDGTLATHVEGGRFVLAVRLPIPTPEPHTGK
jgi:two-component system sensor histidine kinase DesK